MRSAIVDDNEWISMVFKEHNTVIGLHQDILSV